MSILNQIIYSYRRWRMKKKGLSVVIRGSCKMCGKCCQEICLYLDSKWIKKEKQFRKLSTQYLYLQRFNICGKTESGCLKFSCSYLDENHTCMDYENRPGLCKTFPASSIFIQDGKLPDGCGFRMSTEVDFEKIHQKELD